MNMNSGQPIGKKASPALVIGAAIALSVLLFAPDGLAWTHIAKRGESLAQLAAKYYGAVEYSMLIRAANGFMHPDDGRLLQGERVDIPQIVYHKVGEEETWESLAEEYLGSGRRGRFLAEINGAKGDSDLPEGKVIKVPFQLLYVLAPDESLRRICKTYLRGEYSPKWLKRYNLAPKKKYGRGDAILIPLIHVEFTKSEKERIAKLSPAPKASLKDHKTQIDAVAQISSLRELFNNGDYIQVLAKAQRLLGTERLTNPQQIGVYRYLAYAYVAFDETTKAKEAFRKALTLQPGMELSPITTSPKILEVFHAAHTAAPVSPPKDADE